MRKSRKDLLSKIAALPASAPAGLCVSLTGCIGDGWAGAVVYGQPSWPSASCLVFYTPESLALEHAS